MSRKNVNIVADQSGESAHQDIVYKLADLDRYIEQHRVRSTAQNKKHAA